MARRKLGRISSLLLAATFSWLSPARPGTLVVELGFDSGRVEGWLATTASSGSPEIVRRHPGRHPETHLEFDLAGTPGHLLTFASHPTGGEHAPELWLATGAGLVRAWPGPGRELLWIEPTLLAPAAAREPSLAVQRTLGGENGRTPWLRTSETYRVGEDGLALLERVPPAARTVDEILNVAADALHHGLPGEAAQVLRTLPHGDPGIVARAEDAIVEAASYHGIPWDPVPPEWAALQAVLEELAAGPSVSPDRLADPEEPRPVEVRPDPGYRSDLPALPDDPAALTPAMALTIVRSLGFFRPVVTISLKRKYQAYVQTGPLPAGIPVDTFAQYQMALLAVAHGAGGPDQSKLAANRKAYFDPRRAFDLDATVYDWWGKPKLRLRQAVLGEARRLSAVLAAFPDLPDLGRLETEDHYRSAIHRAAASLGTERIGLAWGEAEKVRLLDSLMYQESRRNHWKAREMTVSNAGAIGFGQLMPFNREYHPDLDEYHPYQNMEALSHDMTRWIEEARAPRTEASRKASRLYPTAPMGRLEFALAMYNGGFATTAFAREHYAPSILKMFHQGGPPDPIRSP